MVDMLVDGDVVAEGDARLFTGLCGLLKAGVRNRCVNRLRYDGRWRAAGDVVPNGMSVKRKAQYDQLRGIANLNLAHTIVDAVADRELPRGFRLVNDKTSASTEADEMFSRQRMSMKLIKGNRDVALYGSSFFYVADSGAGEFVVLLSPWECYVSDDEDSAVVYSFDTVEHVTFYRLLRDGSGRPARVYSVDAVGSDTRTLVDEGDDALVERIGMEDGGCGFGTRSFHWDKGSVHDYPYALSCGCLPVVKRRSPDDRSQLDAHWASMNRINRTLFDRLTISMMQAFRQRAVKGLQHTVYEEGDAEVVAGRKRVGDPIDFDSIFESGPNALWLLPDGVDLWESQTTDITPLLTAVQNDIKNLAAAAQIPIDILSPDAEGSAEGASLKREGIVLKVSQLNLLANDAIVRTIRMALAKAGDAQAAGRQFEMMWYPAVPDDMTDMANAASQLVGVLPKKTIQRFVLHFTETELQEARKDMVEEAMYSQLTADPLQQPTRVRADAVANSDDIAKQLDSQYSQVVGSAVEHGLPVGSPGTDLLDVFVNESGEDKTHELGSEQSRS